MKTGIGVALAFMSFLVAQVAWGAEVKVVVLGDEARLKVMQSFSLLWKSTPKAIGSIMQLSDSGHQITLLVPLKEATIFEIANAAIKADFALVAMDSRTGPNDVFREHTILARQTSVPVVGVIISNTEQVAGAKNAQGLLDAKEREARDVFEMYAFKGNAITAFYDSQRASTGSRPAVIGMAATAEWLRQNVIQRKPQPQSAKGTLEYEAIVYLLSTEEAKSVKPIPSGGDLTIWIDGQDCSAKAQTTTAIQPGDNATIVLRFKTQVASQKGSRFFMVRDGHLIGVGTVSKVRS